MSPAVLGSHGAIIYILPVSMGVVEIPGVSGGGSRVAGALTATQEPPRLRFSDPRLKSPIANFELVHRSAPPIYIGFGCIHMP